jgi:hypothetical protein
MDNDLKSKISGFGSAAALFGLVSIVLSFFDYNLRILMWIDMWGETVGWVIRIGLIIVGLAVYFLMKTPDEEVVTEKEVE